MNFLRSFLQQVERVVLFDFSQVTGPLAKYCENDVKQLECHHNQVSWEGGTLACLQLKLDQVKDELCRQYVMKLSELQAEDIHLDRQLYKACAAEYSNLCMNEKDANIDPYSCLIRNRMDKSVSKKCADELSRRLGLMARDYKASKGLARACREDVRANHCRSSVSAECRSRMVAHRRFLFEDYNTSPEVVSGCSSDVAKLCSSYEGAAVIHCLMDHAHSFHRKGHRISKNCLHALEMLAKEADVGENWTVDPVLKKSCREAVEKHCSNAGDTG
ncbi:hypothetical protein J437_LFUL012744 [Ladona fulva]|uniref:Golgi apparatus protein 1 n=1 Tax=Ladona fulva TaxID=123851 RepID=A0A8K0P6T6_LADFU|nr:hypothetical protein J437_LFUL012744 [Ladona fulva]